MVTGNFAMNYHNNLQEEKLPYFIELPFYLGGKENVTQLCFISLIIIIITGVLIRKFIKKELITA